MADYTEHNKLLAELKAKKFAPVYYLYGEEHYFIDLISDFIENNILTDAEKGFNQMVLYGKDSDVNTIVSNARRFPLMAPYQIILVKEAQLLKGLDEFEAYFEKPVPTTILVICNKSSKLDKRTRFYKALTRHVIFESKAIKQNQLAPWIEQYLKVKGYSITPRSSLLIAESLGSDLAKISNELEKLIINKHDDKQITDTDVELKIGISREYNIFEFINALSAKNASRAFHIAHHMGKAKDFSIIGTLSNLSNFLNKAYMVKQSKITDQGKLQREFGLNYYQAIDCSTAAKNYSLDELEKGIRVMHEYDLKSKGVNNFSTTPDQLFKEVLIKII
ncbi:MAG: DNA polymerase III subunit delta [Bacteroidia bacterium]